METKNLYAIFLFNLSLILFSVSCSHTPKINFRNTDEGRSSSKAEKAGGVSSEDQQEEFGQSVDLETKNSSKPYRPKVALILGPGAARTFAHIGLLKEFKTANIDLHSIIGMGWAALVAAEYVDQKSVHGLEWKVSRSETLRKLMSKSFWSSEIKEKTVSDAEDLVASLLTNTKSGSLSRYEFSCPLLSKPKKALIFSNKKGLKNCISVPPLFNPGQKYAPHLFDLPSIKEGAIKMGAEKVIYVDVLNSNSRFFGSYKSSLSGVVYWYWSFVAQMTSPPKGLFDKVIKINVENEILNFDKSLDLVRQGQQAGRDLVEFLQEEYQY